MRATNSATIMRGRLIAVITSTENIWTDKVPKVLLLAVETMGQQLHHTWDGSIVSCHPSKRALRNYTANNKPRCQQHMAKRQNPYVVEPIQPRARYIFPPSSATLCAVSNTRWWHQQGVLGRRRFAAAPLWLSVYFSIMSTSRETPHPENTLCQ